MEASDVEVLCAGAGMDTGAVAQRFLDRNANVFTFPSLSENGQRAVVWTALFNHLQNQQATQVHSRCLAALRVLSRDKTDLESLICEKWINILVERAGLYHLAAYDEESLPSADFPAKDIIVEALKCLCNICFNSEAARAICAHTCLAEGLVCRLRIYRDLPSKDDIMLYDMKLLFVLTALREDIKSKIKNELHGMEYLTSCLKEILSEATAALVEGGHHYLLSDNQQAAVCEIIKTQFNLITHTAPLHQEQTNEPEDAIFLKIMPLLKDLLQADASNRQKQMELRINVSNFLTSVPVSFYPELTPRLGTADEQVQFSYDGRSMDALQVLVELLQDRLSNAQNTSSQFEMLSGILTVLHKASRSCRAQRKYLRSVILPPLTDVSRPPERGEALRNRLCRLLTTPVAQVRVLAAELLFILCKEKVGRMVKYTGFGNAAGLLAQKGLLGGARKTEYSSSSDDSDTEEYLAVQSSLDPVVGCTRPPRANPLEGMSEEQKEYEAMQLVRMFDQLTSSGIIQPARIGSDGRPQPIEHVLELRDSPPNRPQS